MLCLRRGSAFIALFVVAVVIGLMARPVAAQLATPPARVYGFVSVFGQPALPGASVVAYIGPQVCGNGSVTLGGTYQLDVRSAASQAGCGVDGALMTFTVAGQPALESAIYQAGAFIQRDLSVAAPLAQVTVERWAPYAEEPCANPQGPWCIQVYPLPPATEPLARYRMLAALRNGRVVQATGWIEVVPSRPTAPVSVRRERGVVSVTWERWTPAGVAPCGGRIDGVWCVEAVSLPPPITGAVWYRLIVTRPNGATDEPAGFIPAWP